MFVLSPSVEAMKASALLDAGRQRASISSAGPDGELASEVLPALVEADLQSRMRLRVLVETGHLVAFPQHRAARPTIRRGRADDQDEHDITESRSARSRESDMDASLAARS